MFDPFASKTQAEIYSSDFGLNSATVKSEEVFFLALNSDISTKAATDD